MRLFIAEKPSMGAELAKYLPGPASRKDGYIVTGGGVVTWGFGHILRQAEPGEYDARYMKWRAEDLPIIPEQWKLLVSESCQKQFEIVKKLIDEATDIVHAGDPDREGQLLIDEVLEYLNNRKPVQRILLNALDEHSIKKALTDLRDNADFFPLKQSALARARADWLIGMNLSRAFTLAAQRAGHKITLPVGRVKTPTLALVVRREREINAFTAADYFTLKTEFEHVNGLFTAFWKPGEEQAGLDAEGRLADKAAVKTLLEQFSAEKTPGEIAIYETTEKREPQRLPLSLSSLQVLAGKKYGYDPQTVLDTAQKLYERKLTTYPRSDCDFLPTSQYGDAPAILTNLQAVKQGGLDEWAAKADASIESRAWNDSKITAHHAIIPTVERCNMMTLTAVEQHLYFLIAQAYLAQFYPIHVYDQTHVEVHYAKERFLANGRVVTEMGWKELYASDAAEEKKDDEEGVLPAMNQGDPVSYVKGKADKKSTRPPARFTPATLLAAMKEIHKYVKNPDLKKQLKDVSGIGTEATRATIINELIQRGFLRTEKKKKYLVPTDMAYLLIDALPETLTYPDSTAVWEDALQRMAGGEAQLADFLTQQVAITRTICAQALETAIAPEGDHICPQCGQGVLQQRQGKNGLFWGCSRYPACKAAYNDQNGEPEKAKYICVRCKKGVLKRVNGKNGPFWTCSRYPDCRTTYADKDGAPVMPVTTAAAEKKVIS